MKKYYFKDDYTIKCENLTAAEIKEQEVDHGSLIGVRISGLGYVKCKRGDGVPTWRMKK